MTTEIKGYKATMPDGRSWYNSRVAPYVAGETYSYDGQLSLCECGLHFCRSLANVYVAYLDSYQTRVFEVTAYGQCLDNGVKCCANRLRIDRELSPKEILKALVECVPGSHGHGVLFDILWQTVHGVEDPVYQSYDVNYDSFMYARMKERKQLFVDAAMELDAVDERMSALLEDVKAVVAKELGERR